MKTVNIDPYAVHDQVILLLPWYVNKTLQVEELQLVEAHLAICLTCKREIVLLEKLARAVNQSAAVDVVAQNSFNQLKNRLHGSINSEQPDPQVQEEMPELKPSARAASQFGSRPYALAAMLMLSLLVPTFIASEKYGDNAYRTLADADQKKAGGHDIHVVFAAQTSPDTIKGLVAAVDGEIVGQPNDQSVYTLRLVQAYNQLDVQNKLAQLRQNSQVIFAEVAETDLGPQEARQDELR